MSAQLVDAGLARERTVSAWTRTALALVVNGALLLVRHAVDAPQPVAAGLALFALVAALVVLAYAARRSRAEVVSDPAVVPASTAVLALGAAVTLLCLGTTLAVLLAP